MTRSEPGRYEHALLCQLWSFATCNALPTPRFLLRAEHPYPVSEETHEASVVAVLERRAAGAEAELAALRKMCEEASGRASTAEDALGAIKKKLDNSETRLAAELWKLVRRP